MQGASQAMEDGVTLAICLKKAGKDNVPLALKVYERIRYRL
jgi:2-polyprenyl-6-methoxyphenol hydroxylase-like FAD-dependent oxidoreductase